MKMAQLLAPVLDARTGLALSAERAFLGKLDGSCRTPIGGHAIVRAGSIHFRGVIVKPDGSEAFEAARDGRIADAAKLGTEAGRELRERAGADFFARV